MPTATELRELDDDELESRLAEYRRELLNLRFQLATGQLDNYSRLSQVRKDVARVLTLLRDREIAVAEGRPAGPEPAARSERPPSGAPRAPRRRAAGDVPGEAEADDGVVAQADDDDVPESAATDGTDGAAGEEGS